MRIDLAHGLRKVIEILAVVSSVALCSAVLAQQQFGIGDSLLPGPAGNAQAALKSYDPSLFNSMRWRNIGPNRGGRSIASAGVAKRPLEYYFGAVGGGLWKTTDGGTSWNPVTDGQIHSSSVGTVAVSESNPDVVYIGRSEEHTSELQSRSDLVCRLLLEKKKKK